VRRAPVVEEGLGKSLGVGRSRLGRLEGRRSRVVGEGLGVRARLAGSLVIGVGRAAVVERGRSARSGSL
jgi:hypothetical protein